MSLSLLTSLSASFLGQLFLHYTFAVALVSLIFVYILSTFVALMNINVTNYCYYHKIT